MLVNFIFRVAYDLQVNVTGIFFMFQFAYSYFYTVIFVFHFPYMDVYFNLPISKISHIYRNKRLIFHRYMCMIFEIGRFK